MAGMNTERAGRLAWLLGLFGASIWMPVLTWVVLIAGDASGGIVGTAWYGACLGMAWYLAPWRTPGLALWKPLTICLVAIVSGAAFFTIRYELYAAGSRHFVWSMLALIAMFLPAYGLGGKRWSELFPEA